MERLRLLNQAFSEGLITEDEYREHKRVVLCGVDGRASKDPAERCRSGSGDAKEQLTLEDFDRAVQMCMQSLLELVSQLAAVCGQSASAGHAPLAQAAAAPHPRGRCAPRRQRQADSRRDRIRPGPFPPGVMRRVDGRAPARGFAFDMQGQHARGGKPVHQRHLELDDLQVRASPLTCAWVFDNLWPACSAGQPDVALGPRPFGGVRNRVHCMDRRHRRRVSTGGWSVGQGGGWRWGEGKMGQGGDDGDGSVKGLGSSGGGEDG